MLDLYDELKTLLQTLDEQGTSYALCGGLAMAVWGKPRATVDIDLMVPADSVEAATGAARRCGYVFDTEPMTFAGGAVRIRRLTKKDPDSEDVLSIDFLMVTPELTDVWQGRERVSWEAGQLWVVSRAGMIRLKTLRGSGQDRADIEALTDEDPT